MMRALLGDRTDLVRLLDVGTGTGPYGPAFRAVGAGQRGRDLDRSPEMLRLARAKLSLRRALTNMPSCVQADFGALPLADGDADAAILHHVLHFAHQPETVLARPRACSGVTGVC